MKCSEEAYNVKLMARDCKFQPVRSLHDQYWRYKTPAIILLGNLSGFDRGGKILKKKKLKRVLNLSFVSQ